MPIAAEMPCTAQTPCTAETPCAAEKPCAAEMPIAAQTPHTLELRRAAIWRRVDELRRAEAKPSGADGVTLRRVARAVRVARAIDLSRMVNRLEMAGVGRRNNRFRRSPSLPPVGLRVFRRSSRLIINSQGSGGTLRLAQGASIRGSRQAAQTLRKATFLRKRLDAKSQKTSDLAHRND